jgi:hypothetical protein
MPWVKSRATKLNDQVSDSFGNDDSNLDCFCLQPHNFKEIQAGLFICQGYVPEKVAQKEHKFPFTTCTSWGVGD